MRRVGVTVAAGNLQREGLIAYSRRRIAILDGVLLARRACECYGVVNHLYERTPSRSVDPSMCGSAQSRLRIGALIAFYRGTMQ